MIKVRAHTCYLGKTGYSYHSRNFFRELSKYVDLRVRNYTWDSNPDYLNEIDYRIIDTITLKNKDGIDEDYNISHSFPQIPWVYSSRGDFSPDIDIVLMDTDHHYFYENYSSKVKIAYTVWESTQLPSHFFDQLLIFDYLWVVSEWHKEMVIKQGYPQHRVFVVREGVDDSLYLKRREKRENGEFQFMFFGRWDYRKSVPEIIGSFLKAFPDNPDVSLILSADNPFSVDGMNSTEERLDHYGFNDSRIRVKHFLSREEYEDYIKNGDVLITCARSEGWNIPLMEAMAAGTPATYSNWGAQLEFTKGKGNPVKISNEKPAGIGAKLGFAGNTPGLYSEPDFEDLCSVLIDCYENWEEKKRIAEELSEEIYEEFKWEKVGEEGFRALRKVLPVDVEFKGGECAIIMSHADTSEKISILRRSVLSLRDQGLSTIISSHIQVPEEIYEIADFIVIEKDNPVVYSEEYSKYSNTVPIHYLRYPDFDLSYPFDYNHGYAALRLIKNGSSIAESNGFCISHFVNYDYIMDDYSVLESHSNSIRNNSNDVISYRWNGEGSINSGLFSVNPKLLNECLYDFNSKESYFRYEGKVILEDVMDSIFRENGLRIEFRNIREIKNNNILNGVVLSTYPIIATKKGQSSYLYLGEDGKDHFICAMGSPGEPLKLEIGKYSFTANEFPMIFIRIPESLLENGFSVRIPDLNVERYYDRRTKKAKCRISNRNLIVEIEDKNPPSEEIRYNINFTNGPFVEILGNSKSPFQVEFIDQEKNEILYSTIIGVNHWARCNKRYFIDWKIKITNLSTGEIYEERLDLRGKRVLVSIDSKSLGDTLSWFPHIEEFRKKWNCEIYVSTFINQLFTENYPHINFVTPGSIIDSLYSSYSIGWFYLPDAEINYEFHPRDFRKIPMQATTCDILGLNHTNLRADLRIPEGDRPIDKEYVCIAVHSTAQAKYWNNPTGWQEVTDYFLGRGMEVVIVSLEGDGYMQNYYPHGAIRKEGPPTLENAMLYLKHSKMFIGIGSGLSWLSWSIGIPTVIISGFSLPGTEVLDDNIIRIFKGGGCNGCFNRKKLDPGDWNWCPDQKGTHRQFECTRIIKAKDVITEIEKYESLGVSEKSVEIVVQESYELGMVQNHKEIIKAAEFFKDLKVKNFMEIGTDQGGTFAIWSKLSEDGKRISVDLPHGEFGRDSYDVNERDKYLKSLGSNVSLIHGSSHDPGIKNMVAQKLEGNLVDFLFIDGDHTYEGVKEDFEMYKEFVKPGGWIGFHDIKDTEFHRNANCRVDILWNELGGEKIEFLDNSSSYGGIGFIRV